MKPCDCKDSIDVGKLDHDGLFFNNRGIKVKPNSVIISYGSCEMRIWMNDFQRFAEWYLEDQEV